MTKAFSENISTLKNHINSIEMDGGMSEEKLVELEAMFRICDRSVECYQQKPRMLKRYNKLKRRYRDIVNPYKELNSEIAACRMHVEALNRQNRITEISRGVQEIISVSDYINHVLENGMYAVDNITQNLEQGEVYGGLANEQIDATRRKKSWKSRVARSVILLISATIIIIIFVRNIF